MRTPAIQASALAVWFLMGCGPHVGGEAASPPDDLSGTVTETAVRLMPDGSMQFESRSLSREEAQAQLAWREGTDLPPQGARALGIDTICRFSSLWLYDEPLNRGNRLCILREPNALVDSVNLTQVPYNGTSTWAYKVRSFYSGDDKGSLGFCASGTCDPAWSWPFGVQQQVREMPLANTAHIDTATLRMAISNP